MQKERYLKLISFFVIGMPVIYLITLLFDLESWRMGYYDIAIKLLLTIGLPYVLLCLVSLFFGAKALIFKNKSTTTVSANCILFSINIFFILSGILGFYASTERIKITNDIRLFIGFAILVFACSIYLFLKRNLLKNDK